MTTFDLYAAIERERERYYDVPDPPPELPVCSLCRREVEEEHHYFEEWNAHYWCVKIAVECPVVPERLHLPEDMPCECEQTLETIQQTSAR